MRTVTIVEAKLRLLDEVEAGEEFAVTRRGRVVARLVPDRPRVAAEAFRDLWADGDLDLRAPEDLQAEGVGQLPD
jgi:antitoxin (DNA-binding transcriptional repressor) of toxin-antitoxin stability system